MADTIEQRACDLAVYIIESGATVRTAAKVVMQQPLHNICFIITHNFLLVNIY